MTRGLRDGLTEELFLFYRCHRATLRARLAIAHLLEQNPRTPEKWPRLARLYLRIAAADAQNSSGCSKNEEIGERLSVMKPPDRFSEQRRRRQDFDLVAHRRALKPKRGYRIGDNTADRWPDRRAPRRRRP